MPGIITSRTRVLYQRAPTGPTCVNWNSLQSQGLAAWWPVNEGSGKTAYCASGRGHDMAITGATWRPAPVVGGMCLRFVGASSHYAAESEFVSLVYTQPPWSWSCWYYPTLTGTLATMMSAYGSTVPAYELRVNTSNNPVNVTRGALATSTKTYTLNDWNLATGTFPATNSRTIYHNAGTKVTGTGAATNEVSNIFELGRADGGSGGVRYFTGSIMDARVYDYLLSEGVMQAMIDPGTRWQLYYQLGRVSYSFAEADAATGHPAARRFSQCAGYRPTAIGVEGVTIG